MLNLIWNNLWSSSSTNSQKPSAASSSLLPYYLHNHLLWYKFPWFLAFVFHSSIPTSALSLHCRTSNKCIHSFCHQHYDYWTLTKRKFILREHFTLQRLILENTWKSILGSMSEDSLLPSQSAYSAFIDQFRTLCLDEFPCGIGSWVRLENWRLSHTKIHRLIIVVFHIHLHDVDFCMIDDDKIHWGFYQICIPQ